MHTNILSAYFLTVYVNAMVQHVLFWLLWYMFDYRIMNQISRCLLIENDNIKSDHYIDHI
jgi:hypothetical protein